MQIIEEFIAGYLIGRSARRCCLSTNWYAESSYLSTAYKLPIASAGFLRDCFVVFGFGRYVALLVRARFSTRRSALEIFHFIRL